MTSLMVLRLEVNYLHNMKKFLKTTSISLALIILFTSCYTTKVALPGDQPDEVREYISGLEPGDKIRIMTSEGSKTFIHYLAADDRIIKGMDMGLPKNERMKNKNLKIIDIDRIQKIDTINNPKTVWLVFGGFAAVFWTIIFLTSEGSLVSLPQP